MSSTLSQLMLDAGGTGAQLDDPEHVPETPSGTCSGPRGGWAPPSPCTSPKSGSWPWCCFEVIPQVQCVNGSAARELILWEERWTQLVALLEDANVRCLRGCARSAGQRSMWMGELWLQQRGECTSCRCGRAVWVRELQ